MVSVGARAVTPHAVHALFAPVATACPSLHGLVLKTAAAVLEAYPAVRRKLHSRSRSARSALFARARWGAPQIRRTMLMRQQARRVASTQQQTGYRYVTTCAHRLQSVKPALYAQARAEVAKPVLPMLPCYARPARCRGVRCSTIIPRLRVPPAYSARCMKQRRYSAGHQLRTLNRCCYFQQLHGACNAASAMASGVGQMGLLRVDDKCRKSNKTLSAGTGL